MQYFSAETTGLFLKSHSDNKKVHFGKGPSSLCSTVTPRQKAKAHRDGQQPPFLLPVWGVRSWRETWSFPLRCQLEQNFGYGFPCSEDRFGGLLLFSLFWSITSFRFCVTVLAMMPRRWHKHFASLLGAFQAGQIYSMGIAGTPSGSKFFCYGSTGMPVEKGQGNSFSRCASPWKPPCHLLPACTQTNWFAPLSEPPGSPLWADTKEDPQIKRNQHRDKGKALQESKVLQWSSLSIFFHLCFCYCAISFSFPVW